MKRIRDFLGTKVGKDNLLPVAIAGTAAALGAVLVIDIAVKAVFGTVV